MSRFSDRSTSVALAKRLGLAAKAPCLICVRYLQEGLGELGHDQRPPLHPFLFDAFPALVTRCAVCPGLISRGAFRARRPARIRGVRLSYVFVFD